VELMSSESNKVRLPRERERKPVVYMYVVYKSFQNKKQKVFQNSC
jgi:hypothetical protein